MMSLGNQGNEEYTQSDSEKAGKGTRTVAGERTGCQPNR